MPIPCPSCQRAVAPGATACPACGASLLPESTPGAPRPVRVEQPLPWDQREELGTARALWKTVVQLILRPSTFDQVRAEGRPRDSLLFVLLCSIPACFVAGLAYMAITLLVTMGIANSPHGNMSETHQTEFRWLAVSAFVSVTLFGPLLSVAINVVNAGLDHLVLRANGITRPFRVTLRACSLSQAPWALGVVPFFGLQVAPFWALVVRFFAYRGLHRTTTGVALAGALVAPLVSCCLCFGGQFAFMFLTFSRFSHRA